MPSAQLRMADVDGRVEYGGFAQATCHSAALETGNSRITSELTGSTRHALAHFVLAPPSCVVSPGLDVSRTILTGGALRIPKTRRET